MPVQFSKRILSLSPSPTLTAAARAARLREEGRDVISFTVGEPDFDTPQHVKDAAREALEKGFTKYTAVGGIKPLKEAIVSRLKRDLKIEAELNQVLVTNGGKQALACACSVLLDPGDEAIIAAPYWTSYPDMVLLAEGKPVIVQTRAEDGYLLKPEALKAACSSRTKMLILNTPSNPTGACYSAKDIELLAQTILQLPCCERMIVISDEVYDAITYDGFSHVSFLQAAPQLRERTLLINAFSKTYSMTGWRVGYAFGPKEIIELMDTHQSQFTSNVCSIAQYAAAKAYDDRGQFPELLRDEFNKRLNLLCSIVEDIPGVSLNPKPKGAFYVFLDVRQLLGKQAGGVSIKTSQDFADYLLDRHDVVVVPGEAFGAEGYIRLSFALDMKLMEKGLDRIRNAAKEILGL